MAGMVSSVGLERAIMVNGAVVVVLGADPVLSTAVVVVPESTTILG
jgi:hypothetical protein